MSKKIMPPSRGKLYLISIPLPASRARFRACSTSPPHPSARQVSPFADPRYNVQCPRIASTAGSTSALSQLPPDHRATKLLGFLPRKINTVLTTSEDASKTDTPQSLNFETTAGRTAFASYRPVHRACAHEFSQRYIRARTCPQIIDPMLIARIVQRNAPENIRVHVLQIGSRDLSSF